MAFAARDEQIVVGVVQFDPQPQPSLGTGYGYSNGAMWYDQNLGSFAGMVNGQASPVTAPQFTTSQPNTGFAVFNAATPITMLPSGHTAGLFRVDSYMVVNTPFSTCTSVSVAFGYTDNYNSAIVTQTLAALTAGSKFTSRNPINLFSSGTAAITYTPQQGGSACTAGAGSFYISMQRVL